MKNIHVLETDKTITKHKKGSVCRYVYNNRKNQPLILCANDCFESGSHYQFYNIYITSDEEIKEGDYVTDDENDILEVIEIDKKQELARCVNFTYVLESCKKIILTTDQDLIKDGVQAIDDEFLEWFVKNPSCEFVEVKPLLSNNGRALFGYKTIIPKEEPIQEILENLENQLKKVIKEHPIDVNEDTYWRGVKIGLKTSIEVIKFKVW